MQEKHNEKQNEKAESSTADVSSTFHPLKKASKEITLEKEMRNYE